MLEKAWLLRLPAQVAHLHGAPFLALKGITDIVDGDRPPQEEFLENLHRAAQALQARMRMHLMISPQEGCLSGAACLWSALALLRSAWPARVHMQAVGC